MNDIYEVSESVMLTKQIAADTAEAVVAEDKKKKALTVILICSIVVAVAAVVTAILVSKNKDGERRGKVVLMKIKEKLPSKKKKETLCEELAEDDCEFEEM